MSQPSLLPGNCRRRPRPFAALLTALFLAPIASASPTIQLYLGGDLDVPDDTVAVLVVDRAGNGFHPLDHITSIGTRLTVGESVGLSDDLIVGVLQADDSGFAGPGRGYIGILRNLPYPPHQLSPGMAMMLYWFPGHQSSGEALANGDTFEAFRADSPDGASGGNLGFALPDRRGVHTLAFVGPADGGAVSLSSPGAAGLHLSGQVGTSTTPPGGGGPVDLPGTGGPTTTYSDSGLLPGHVGTHLGLISDAGSRFSGEISAFLSPRGLATLTLHLHGRRHLVRGTFDPDTGAFTSVASAPDLTLDLQLAVADTGGTAITGSITSGGETRDLILNRSATPTDAAGSARPGLHTLLLPTDPAVNPAIIPGGAGFGVVNVLPSGRILARLTLGDGTRVTDATALDADGRWNLFQLVYGGNGGGFVAGYLTFHEIDNISDLDGSVHWKKNPAIRQGRLSRYPSGFELVTHAVGSRYQAPRPGERILSQVPDGADNVNWTVGGAMLDPAPGVIPLSWQPNNLIPLFNDGVERLQVLLSPATGEVLSIHQQSVTSPGGRPEVRRVISRGIALQKQGIIAGLTLLPTATDHFSLQSSAQPILTITDGGGAGLGSGGTLSFGDIGLDGGVGERLVEISNSGSGNLLLPSAPLIEGAGFSLVAGRAGYLAPGESSSLRVRFAPSAAGPATGILVIVSNDREHHPFVLNLAGNGIADSSQSNIEGGDHSLLTLRVDLSSTPAGAFDSSIHAGWYRGVMISPDGGQILLLINRGGAFSGTATLGGLSGRFRGSVNPDGTLAVLKFLGPLAASHQLDGLALAQLIAGGSDAIVGELNAGDSGDPLAFTLVRTTDRADINAPQIGKFTLVLPAMEDLGVGYPPGDGIATVLVNPAGTVNLRLLLADRQRRSLSSRLDGSGSQTGWSFHQRWPLGEITGRMQFAASGEADLQGTAIWQRFGHPRQRQYPDGFTVEIPVLGSAFQSEPGQRLIPIPPGESTAMTANLAGPFDPPPPAQALQWRANNVFTDDSADDGSLRLTANRGNGWISGFYLKTYVDTEGRTQRQRILVDGVVFQKQALITGNADAAGIHGSFGVDVVE